MAISTYAELKSSVLNDLLRASDTDAGTRFDDWLAKFEAYARRELSGANAGEIRASNAVISNEYTSLPADLISIRSATIVVNGVTRPLDATSAERLDEDYSGSAGDPKAYAIVGSAIRLGPPPNGTYTVKLMYTQLAALTSSATTNWLLTAAPDVYENGVLAYALDYYKSFEESDRRMARANAGIAALVKQAKTNLPAGAMSPRIQGYIV